MNTDFYYQFRPSQWESAVEPIANSATYRLRAGGTTYLVLASIGSPVRNGRITVLHEETGVPVIDMDKPIGTRKYTVSDMQHVITGNILRLIYTAKFDDSFRKYYVEYIATEYGVRVRVFTPEGDVEDDQAIIGVEFFSDIPGSSRIEVAGTDFCDTVGLPIGEGSLFVTRMHDKTQSENARITTVDPDMLPDVTDFRGYIIRKEEEDSEGNTRFVGRLFEEFIVRASTNFNDVLVRPGGVDAYGKFRLEVEGPHLPDRTDRNLHLEDTMPHFAWLTNNRVPVTLEPFYSAYPDMIDDEAALSDTELRALWAYALYIGRPMYLGHDVDNTILTDAQRVKENAFLNTAIGFFRSVPDPVEITFTDDEGTLSFEDYFTKHGRVPDAETQKVIIKKDGALLAINFSDSTWQIQVAGISLRVPQFGFVIFGKQGETSCLGGTVLDDKTNEVVDMLLIPGHVAVFDGYGMSTTAYFPELSADLTVIDYVNQQKATIKREAPEPSYNI